MFTNDLASKLQQIFQTKKLLNVYVDFYFSNNFTTVNALLKR